MKKGNPKVLKFSVFVKEGSFKCHYLKIIVQKKLIE